MDTNTLREHMFATLMEMVAPTMSPGERRDLVGCFFKEGTHSSEELDLMADGTMPPPRAHFEKWIRTFVEHALETMDSTELEGFVGEDPMAAVRLYNAYCVFAETMRPAMEKDLETWRAEQGKDPGHPRQ